MPLQTTTADAKRHASTGIVYLARGGYAARGVIYVLVGGLALLSALGRGGSTTGSKGALEKILDSPGGWIILIIVGVGLAGHALWRAVQAALDPDRLGTDIKGWTVRAGMVISAVVHTGLAIWAVRRGIGYAAGGNDEGYKSWTVWLMGQPLGQWLVGIVGGCIIGAGVGQMIKGWKGKFRERLDVSDEFVRRLMPVCRFGLVARGAVLGIIGSFFIYAGWTYDPDNAGGLEQAFDAVRGVALGQFLLGATALGMVSFAVYSFIQAWYRRINSPM